MRLQITVSFQVDKYVRMPTEKGVIRLSLVSEAPDKAHHAWVASTG